MEPQPEPQPRDRSLFWPIVLIGAGTLWLLVNYNVIQGFEWWQLLRLWPLFLIAAGLELLFGRNRPWVGAIVGLLTVGAAVALLYYAPQLGLNATSTVRTERFTEPVGEAASAEVNLDLASYHTDIQALSDSTDLIDADLAFTGEIAFNVSGGRRKTVNLRHVGGFSGPWDWFDQVDARWNIGLSPDVPLDLNVDLGSGSSTLNLGGLQLTSLSLDGGSGALQLTLPAGGAETSYEARLEGGSGANSVRLAGAANATFRYEGASGALSLDLPAGQAVRIEVQDSGSGAVRLPSGLETVREDDDDEGVWESEGFDRAEYQLVILIEEVGSGSITIR